MEKQQFVIQGSDSVVKRLEYEAPVCKIVEMMSEGELLVSSFGASNEDFDSTDYGDDIWLN